MKQYSDYNNLVGSSCGPLAHPNIFGSTEEKGKPTKILCLEALKKKANQQKFYVLKVAT